MGSMSKVFLLDGCLWNCYNLSNAPAAGRQKEGTSVTEPVVAVVGSINMDLVVQSDRLPGPGENVMGSAFRMIPGGKGANQAVAAARMGARTCLVGGVGLDTFGENLLANLADNAVDISGVKRDSSSTTGVALIVVDDGGENRINIVG